MSRAKAFPPPRSRASLIRGRTGLRLVLQRFLEAQVPIVTAQLAKILGLAKVSDDAETRAQQAVANLVLDWDDLVEQVAPHLAAVAVAGGRLALEQLGDGMFDRFGEAMRVRAEEFARNRAAELVGRKWVGGVLVDNPNPRWAITQTTREMIQGYVRDAIEAGDSTDDLAARLKESFAFSQSRATTVARSEIAMADSDGALSGWRSTGLVRWKTWLPDSDPCPVCRGFAAEGKVPLEHTYGNTGRQAPPAHPNCECTLLPELEELPG